LRNLFCYLYTVYSLFLFWLAHNVDMLEVIEALQENAEIVRRHEAHGRFWFHGTGSAEEE